jgi:nucleolar GTP-binding protein
MEANMLLQSSFMEKLCMGEERDEAASAAAVAVGHMDHCYLRWLVLRLPALPSVAARECSPAEVHALAALRCLRAAVVFVVDPSEQCGSSLQEQVALFQQVRAVVGTGTLMAVLNKTDLVRVEELPSSAQAHLRHLEDMADAEVLRMSVAADEGVREVKEAVRSLIDGHDC